MMLWGTTQEEAICRFKMNGPNYPPENFRLTAFRASTPDAFPTSVIHVRDVAA